MGVRIAQAYRRKQPTMFVAGGVCIQLFQERLSEKVQATIPKGTASGFEFTVLQRNLREWQERPWTYV